MDEITVDVLITFYNQEKYVDRAMQSVFSQKGNFRLRVLIGDDGSTDGTVVKIQKWQEQYPKRIFVFTMERNEFDCKPSVFRASRNRLNLLKHVISDYFIFMDGDDFFDSIDKLQKQISVLENEDNRDCVACGHAIDALYEDGTRRAFATICNRKKKFTLRDYWPETYFHTNTILFRHEVTLETPSSLFENCFDDNGITFLFLHKGKIFYLPESMAVYCLTGDGLWTGESEIRRLILEILFYDVVMQYDSSLKFETRNRFFSVWKDLFKIKNNVDPVQLSSYVKEADEKNLVFSKLWLQYNYVGLWEHVRLYIEFLFIILSRFIYKGKQAIKRLSKKLN